MATIERYEKITKAIPTKIDLTKKTITIVGLGSLGSALAESFTRMGVNLRIVDKGRVTESGLTTQSLFLPEEDTKFKAKEAKKHLEEINPSTKVKSFHEDLKEDNIFLIDSDVVIDCTQNWKASLLLNNHCKKKKIPLIYTKLAGADGIIIAVKAGYAHTKLEPIVEKMGTVKENGLLPATVHQAASIVLTKTLKLLSEEKISDKLMHFDAWKRTKRETKL